MRKGLLLVGLLVAPLVVAEAQAAQDLDQSLRRLVADYIDLYTRETLAKWRALFLPTFTAASVRADSGVSVRTLDEFYSSQERAFASATRMGERLENVQIDRRGRMASVWADFVYWHDDPGRKGRLVLTAIFQRDGWKFHSLMFSYYD